MPCCKISDCAQMSKTIIAVRHFGLGGRESLETAVMQLKLCDQDNFDKMTVLFEPQQIQKSSNIGAVRAPFSGWRKVEGG